MPLFWCRATIEPQWCSLVLKTTWETGLLTYSTSFQTQRYVSFSKSHLKSSRHQKIKYIFNIIIIIWQKLFTLPNEIADCISNFLKREWKKTFGKRNWKLLFPGIVQNGNSHSSLQPLSYVGAYPRPKIPLLELHQSWGWCPTWVLVALLCLCQVHRQIKKFHIFHFNISHVHSFYFRIFNFQGLHFHFFLFSIFILFISIFSIFIFSIFIFSIIIFPCSYFPFPFFHIFHFHIFKFHIFHFHIFHL